MLRAALLGLTVAGATPDTLDAELQSLQAQAAKGTSAYAIVESLTTKVGARLAGTEAEARARAWAVEKFDELGFEARIEPATVEGWERGVEKATVTRPYPQALSITALGLSVATPKGGLEAPVLRVRSLDDLEARANAEVKGKIIFIDQSMARTQDGSGYGAVVRIRSRGPSTAARKGAQAVVIRSVGTDHHRFPHTGMLRYAEDAPAIPAAALSVPDAEQLSRILALSDDVRLRLELRPRRTGTRPTGNVVADLKGRTRPEEIVLIGAHLDSWDLGTGAIDDGAGVGIVMATLQLLRQMPQRPERTVRVVLFGAEEVGLVGAKAYAKTHADTLDQHVLAAESDFGAGPIYALSADVGEAAWPKIEDLHTRVQHLKVILGENGMGPGPDIYPLRGEGVPSLIPKQDGTDYFDVHHTADDTIDRIDPKNLDQNVAVYATLIWAVANTNGSYRPLAQDR
ncbi:MAG: M20/M25/M40 family metallo-hydrolase [Myxococcota bacterium]